MDTKDGDYQYTSGRVAFCLCSGLSMRDYLAAGVAHSIQVWSFEGDMTRLPEYAANVAKTAYAIADAMLAERDRK